MAHQQLAVRGMPERWRRASFALVFLSICAQVAAAVSDPAADNSSRTRILHASGKPAWADAQTMACTNDTISFKYRSASLPIPVSRIYEIKFAEPPEKELVLGIVASALRVNNPALACQLSLAHSTLDPVTGKIAQNVEFVAAVAAHKSHAEQLSQLKKEYAEQKAAVRNLDKELAGANSEIRRLDLALKRLPRITNSLQTYVSCPTCSGSGVTNPGKVPAAKMAVRNKDGATTTFVRDAEGRLISVTDPDGVTLRRCPTCNGARIVPTAQEKRDIDISNARMSNQVKLDQAKAKRDAASRGLEPAKEKLKLLLSRSKEQEDAFAASEKVVHELSHTVFKQMFQ